MSQESKAFGAKAENLVAYTLEKAGFTILERNYVQRQGEIDIIAQRTDLLVFVEVKARHKQLFDMAQIVNSCKQRRIIAAAKHYLMHHNNEDKVCRFDVAFVEDLENNTISYIANAFVEQE